MSSTGFIVVFVILLIALVKGDGPCNPDPCKSGEKCMVDRKYCPPLIPCPQYKCESSGNNENKPDPPKPTADPTKQPCDPNPCTDGYVCIPQFKVCFGSQCKHYRCEKEKTGVCPKLINQRVICADLCGNDANCPNEEKCCTHSCGKVCKQPVRQQSTNSCSPNPCKTSQRCIPEKRICFTSPCPQYRCEDINPCSSNPCNNDQRCVPQKRMCFTTPCPQYRCENLNNNINNPCIPNPCLQGQSCSPDRKFCVTYPCPQYKCSTSQNVCPVNQTMNQCGNRCDPTCTNRSPVCPLICDPPACACNAGYYRDGQKCVRPYDCPNSKSDPCSPNPCTPRKERCVPSTKPCQGGICMPFECIPYNTGQCGPNEYLEQCGRYCEKGCLNFTQNIFCARPTGCFTPACTCRNGYLRSGSQCILPTQCPNVQCGPTEEYAPCGKTCEKTCQNFNLLSPCAAVCNQPSCTCKMGYARKGNKCVLPSECYQNDNTKNPCSPNPCGYGYNCVQDRKVCITTGPCPQYRCVRENTNVIKPGQCPIVVTGGPSTSCVSLCNSDSDCSGTSKCCAYGCGRRCLAPVNQQTSPCSPNPCAYGQTCVADPKQCFTTPCLQYKCNTNNIDNVNDCNPNPCGTGYRCVPEKKFCFTNPCPQFRCERSADTGNTKPGICPKFQWPVNRCASGCQKDSDCDYNWKCCSDGGCVTVCMRPQ